MQPPVQLASATPESFRQRVEPSFRARTPASGRLDRLERAGCVLDSGVEQAVLGEPATEVALPDPDGMVHGPETSRRRCPDH